MTSRALADAVEALCAASFGQPFRARVRARARMVELAVVELDEANHVEHRGEIVDEDYVARLENDERADIELACRALAEMLDDASMRLAIREGIAPRRTERRCSEETLSIELDWG